MIDAIILALINIFSKLDWGLAKYSNFFLVVKGGPESSAITFFSFLSSLILSVPLIIFHGKGLILLTIIGYLFISYYIDKRYLGKYKTLSQKVNQSIYKSFLIRRLLIIAFILTPVFEVLILRKITIA